MEGSEVMGHYVYGFMTGSVVGVFIFSFTVMVPLTSPNNVWQSQAAQRGYAEYCIPDGKFAWKGECGQ